MPGYLIVDGREDYIPEISEIINFKQEPKLLLKMGEDMQSRRGRTIRSVVNHNTKNIETKLISGIGPDTRLGNRISRLWSTDNRNGGAHLSVDWDGTVGQHADLLLHAAYHASQVNEVSIGIEIYEDSKGRVYSHQLDVCVDLNLWLCKRFQIQLQIQTVGIADLETYNKPIPRMLKGGKDCVGVFGHCHARATKAYDPGIHIFQKLRSIGFRELNFRDGMDIAWWRGWQASHGLKADGIPGSMTADVLQDSGYAYGLWLPPEASPQ